MTLKTPSYFPRWTKLARIEETGKDPLGLSRVHERLTEWLVPGVTTQTHRARYYSFYLWAVHDTNLTDQPQSRREFIEGMRRREATFVLACLAHHDGDAPPSHLVGSREGKKIWKRDRESPSGLSIAFDPLPSNGLGGYGQYYGGSLYRLGLTCTPEESMGVDKLTPEGEQIAESFARRIAGTQYFRERYQQKNRLSLKVLTDLGKRACLDQLAAGSDSERKLLIALFFGLGQHDHPDACYRRETMLFCLDAISSVARVGIKVAERDEESKSRFDSLAVDQVACFRQMRSGKSIWDYIPPGRLEHCVERWRLFALHRYFSAVLEHLLSSLLVELARTRMGLALDEFLAGLNWKDIAACFENWARKPRGDQLVEWLACVLGASDGISKSASQSFDRNMRLGATLNEVDLADKLGLENSVAEDIALALLLLFSLYCRFYHYRSTVWWNETAKQARDDIWFQVVAKDIDNHLKQGSTVMQFLRNLLLNRVIRQHDQVLYQKGHTDSPWFLRDAEKLIWQRDYSPYPRSSKMENCLSILNDLNLVSVNDRGFVTLTNDGKVLRRQLLNE